MGRGTLAENFSNVIGRLTKTKKREIKAAVCINSKEAEKIGISSAKYRDQFIFSCEKKGYRPLVLFIFEGEGKAQRASAKDKIYELVNKNMIDAVVLNDETVLDADEGKRKDFVKELEKKSIHVEKIELGREKVMER